MYAIYNCIYEKQSSCLAATHYLLKTEDVEEILHNTLTNTNRTTTASKKTSWDQMFLALGKKPMLVFPITFNTTETANLHLFREFKPPQLFEREDRIEVFRPYQIFTKT